jgi:hypothetical protein
VLRLAIAFSYLMDLPEERDAELLCRLLDSGMIKGLCAAKAQNLISPMTARLLRRNMRQPKNKAQQQFLPEVAVHPKGMPAREAIKSEVLRMGLTNEDADCIIDHWLANGFKHGRNPVKSWTAVIRNWKAQKYFPSQKQGKVDRTSRTDWSKYK